VSDERTAITEIVTGLGMTGAPSLDLALAWPPPSMSGVGEAAWDVVRRARSEGRHGALFESAWANGESFARSPEALRYRQPLTVQWKGPHKPPGYDSLPADLRVDHVYLVSCKYGSTISANCSPSNVFDRLLADRRAGSDDWYETIAPDAYQAFYVEVRREVGADLPSSVGELRAPHVEQIRERCARRWPGDLDASWRAFSYEVAAGTAARWRAGLATTRTREQMLWRLLRLESSPYFVLGSTKSGDPLRYRVATPWDWRQAFELRSFDISAAVVGQPLVRWVARVVDRALGSERTVEGEIEVRWSHGRFSAVEAKLHLTTLPHEIAGYVPLEG
jgi:hypothetical protein